MKKIDSLRNDNIKKIIKLRKANNRKKENIIIIEGKKEIELALASGWSFLEFYFDREKAKKIDLNFPINNIIEVSHEVFKKISYRDKPDGYLALAHPHRIELKDIKLRENPLILILEKVEKPGNLGALLRTADATGVDLIILNESQTDIYNPNVIRASRGAVFTVPIINMSVQEIKAFFKKNKIKSFGATGRAKNNYTDMNFKESSAILLGAENVGLSQEWLSEADELIRIPMQGKIDSLNVSVAGAVIIYEIIRQRSIKK